MMYRPGALGPASGPPPTSVASSSDTLAAPDNNDPHRLLKLSHSLRYQLRQPLAKQPVAADQQFQAPQVQVPPGHVSEWGPQQPMGPQQQVHPFQQQQQQQLYPGSPQLLQQQQMQQQPWVQHPQQQQHHGSPQHPQQQPGMQHPQAQLPPINGPGTRSGPYTGFASKDWLQ
ncbi:hypothetical protein TSOC_002884, partial [Tetrabaena socialis]